jgi:hypothetical protein
VLTISIGSVIALTPTEFATSYGKDQIVTRIPTVTDFAKHTQGMPAALIVNYIATLL